MAERNAPARAVQTPSIADRPGWSRRAGTFLLRVLEDVGSHPSVWDPWLLQTPHRAAARGFGRRSTRNGQC